MVHEPVQKFAAYVLTATLVGLLVLMWIVTAPLVRWGLFWRNRFRDRPPVPMPSRKAMRTIKRVT